MSWKCECGCEKQPAGLVTLWCPECGLEYERRDGSLVAKSPRKTRGGSYIDDITTPPFSGKSDYFGVPTQDVDTSASAEPPIQPDCDGEPKYRFVHGTDPQVIKESAEIPSTFLGFPVKVVDKIDTGGLDLRGASFGPSMEVQGGFLANAISKAAERYKESIDAYEAKCVKDGTMVSGNGSEPPTGDFTTKCDVDDSAILGGTGRRQVTLSFTDDNPIDCDFADWMGDGGDVYVTFHRKPKPQQPSTVRAFVESANEVYQEGREGAVESTFYLTPLTFCGEDPPLRVGDAVDVIVPE